MYQDVGAVIKAAMAEKSLSLRKLSELCKISPSTISRIINNKQSASIGHLQQFSRHLNIPIEQLFQAVGISVGDAEDKSSDFISSMIRGILQSFEIDLGNIISDIQKELRKYEGYAKTESGREVILRGFLFKINELNGEGIIIERFKAHYGIFIGKDTDPDARGVAGSALLYFIMAPDVIPDYAFPVGYLDDAIAVSLTAERLLNEFNISV